MSFIKGRVVALEPLTPEHIGPPWLSWLNNPAIMRWRARRMPYRASEMARHVDNAEGDLRLAIEHHCRHVGNIALGSINWAHRSAELSILVGKPGLGYGTDAVEALARHALQHMGLNRLWAESPNPAFNRIMGKLGWTHEGTKREAFMLDGRFISVECWGLLAAEGKQSTRSA